MKRLTLGVALTLCGCQQPSGPSLALLNPAIDLGTINTEGSYRVQLNIENRGAKPLSILEVETSCGCTTPSFPKSLAPGRKGTITVDYQPLLMLSGPRTERLTILSNDPSQPSVTASLTSILRPPITFDPPIPVKVSFQPGRAKKVTLRATSRDGVNAPITSVEANDPRTPGKVSRDGTSSLLTLSLGGAKSAGNYNVKLRIGTKLKSVPFIETRVFGQAQQGPSASPALLEVHNLSARSSGTRLGTLSISGAAKVLSVDSADPAIQGTIEHDKNSSRTWILIKYVGGWKPGKRTAMLKIRTNHPQLPTIETPVVVKVSE